MMQKKINPKFAKCLCGGIKIKVKGKLRHVINCHCLQCMRSHGNYAAYTACPENNITFINKRTLKWYKSSNIPSKLQLGIFGCLLTLLYDVLTSILSLPVLFNLLYGNFDKFWFLIGNLLIGLFLPLGGFLWPAGPAHELFTALLLVFIGPTLIRRIKLILNDKYN